MEVWLHLVAKQAILAINAVALIVVVAGTIEALIVGTRTWLSPSDGDREFRGVTLRYGGWLVAGLTFQLAADIIETSITPTWEDLGKLGAVAAIRTFLSYFLERELSALRAHGGEPTPPLGR